MSIKCFMNGLEVNYPCSPNCALFGDCVTAFEAQKKASVRTNADRIRAMSDEELFVAIQKTYIGNSPWCDHHCKLDDDCSCSACLKEWLKQPVEVDNKHKHFPNGDCK